MNAVPHIELWLFDDITGECIYWCYGWKDMVRYTGIPKGTLLNHMYNNRQFSYVEKQFGVLHQKCSLVKGERLTDWPIEAECKDTLKLAKMVNEKRKLIKSIKD